MSEPLISATDLSVGYATGVPVCAPVTLELRPGEVVAVVGANGTGKSTLVRTLTGVLPALAGTIRVLGRPVDDRSARQRAALAVDLGDDAFFPALTVREHLEMVCFGHGVDNTAEVVRGLLTEFGLGHRAGAMPDALSSGQRRRLLLAAAFARPHELLILDEPEQRLDAGMRARLTQMLREESQAGVGVLLVTHEAGVVRACATRGIVLGEEDVQDRQTEETAQVIEAM